MLRDFNLFFSIEANLLIDNLSQATPGTPHFSVILPEPPGKLTVKTKQQQKANANRLSCGVCKKYMYQSRSLA